jgi:endoglucanase
MTHLRAMTGLLALLAVHAIPAHAAADEMLPDPAFAQPTLVGEWWATPNIKAEYRPGSLCGQVAGGAAQPWDAILGFNGLSLSKGERYRLSITVSGDPGGPMRALAQKAEEPWTAEGEITRRVGDGQQTLTEDFTAAETHASAQLVFQLGGSDTPWRFCLHAASLQSGQEPDAGASSGALSAIRVNQFAYFPDGPKHATLVRKDRARVEWRMIAASGETVASGFSRPEGR